jgi:hypothetical protein
MPTSLLNTTNGAGTVNFSEHLSSPPVFSGVHVIRSLVLCVCFADRCLSFCLFTDSDYPYGIFKLFLKVI